MSTERDRNAAVWALALTVPLEAWNGWVLWLAARWWGPRLHAPTLPFGHAVALAFFVAVLVVSPSVTRITDLFAILRAQIMTLAVCTMTLGVLGLVVR